MKQEKSLSKGQDTHEIQLWIDQLDKDGGTYEWVRNMLSSYDSVLAEEQKQLEMQIRFLKKHRETCHPRVKALNYLVDLTANLMPPHQNATGLRL